MPCAVDTWKPRIIGKIGRIVCGVGMMLGAYKCTLCDTLDMYLLLWIIATIYVSKYGINLGFQKPHWGEMTRYVIAIMFALLLAIGRTNLQTQYYSLIILNVLIMLFWSFIGIAYILCGILGIGGCELNSYHIIWNHVKYNRCSCDEIDCSIIVSPLYLY